MNFMTTLNCFFTEGDDDHTDESLQFEIHGDTDAPSHNDLVTSAEIRRCIGKLKNGKCLGNNNIVNEYVKCTQDLLCTLYVKLFNKILDTGVSPSEWLTGVIVPLYKNKGDVNDTNNYRGITL